MKNSTHNNRPVSLGLVLHGIGLALLAIAVGSYYYFAYGTVQDQQASDLQRIEQLANFLQRSGPVSILHHQLQKDVAKLDAKGEKFRTRLSQPLNGEELTKTLHSIAAVSGLEISQLTMEKPTLVATHRQSDVQLHCTGSYASMCLFLEGLSESRWIADVTQLTVSNSEEGQEHKMLATLTVYYDRILTDSNKT